MKKYIIAVILVMAVLAIAAPRDVKVGYLQIKVVDGFSDEPLRNALIVLPEMGVRMATGSGGLTPVISLPINRIYISGETTDWGETTILAYAEGYAAYVLYHYRIIEGVTRTPTLLLFSGDEPIILCEGPDDSFSKNLINKYQPD